MAAIELVERLSLKNKEVLVFRKGCNIIVICNWIMQGHKANAMIKSMGYPKVSFHVCWRTEVTMLCMVVLSNTEKFIDVIRNSQEFWKDGSTMD